MTGIILSLGGLMVFGGGRIVNAYSMSLMEMDRLSQVRNLQILLARQKATLDSYFQMNDIDELHHFDVLSRLISQRLQDIGTTSEGDARIAGLQSQYQQILASVRKMSSLPQGGKSQDLSEYRQNLRPSFHRLLEALRQTEFHLDSQARHAQDRMKQLLVYGSQLAFFIIVAGALSGLFFAFRTYRSLTESLQILHDGSVAFGGGNWDYRIPLSSRDELGELAHSFNEMARNIKQLEGQNIHMHRMSAVGQLAGGVAHEINNPLTGVLGQAQVLLDKLPPDNPHRHHIEKIERAAVRCKQIVRSLLDFSRQKEAPFSLVDLKEAVESTLDLCEPDLQKSRISVKKHFEPESPPTLGNSSQLQQVFLNLVSNAIQAMPDGGTLSIHIQKTSFVYPNGAEGKPVEGVEIRFSDTGVGIDSPHLSHVFEPFFTTKEIGKGTGLGLSVSLGIIRNHGGNIVVESTGVGKGATFRVFLPVQKDLPSPGDAVINEPWRVPRFGVGTPSRF